jgi:tetratricopeptide (TPR) repeat protein
VFVPCAAALMFSILAKARSFPSQNPRRSHQEAAESATVKKLYDEGKWDEVLRVAPADGDAPADIDFYRGLALAKLKRWHEARIALLAGARRAPRDERFPVELAGVAYKQKDFRAAERELRRALRLDPHDSYALNFLAAIFFLRGNLEAALEYWNRADLPRINQVRASPEPDLKAELFDRAFAFAPLSILELSQFETTQARLSNLGIFSFYHWEFVPSEDAEPNSPSASADATFDVTFHSLERDGFGANKWIAALSMLRGLPYETIYPEYDNAFHSAVNVDSLFRFDSERLRAFADVSAPVGGLARWRARAWVDGRDENWNISGTFFGSANPISDLKLRQIQAGAEFCSVQSGRWNWGTGIRFARRSFGRFSGLETTAKPFFTDGNSLELFGHTRYLLVSVPQDRITIDSSASADLGRFYAATLGNYARAAGALAFDWRPAEQGDDYEVSSRFRVGGTIGLVPFDELYTLGVEQDDNDLWLRGISALREGRKGNSPMGRDYALWNSEVGKIIYAGALFQVRLGPLFDAGRVWDPSGLFGSRGWLWDPGAQVKVRVLDTVEVVLSYGHDIRSGQNTFFGTTER